VTCSWKKSAAPCRGFVERLSPAPSRERTAPAPPSTPMPSTYVRAPASGATARAQDARSRLPGAGRARARRPVRESQGGTDGDGPGHASNERTRHKSPQAGGPALALAYGLGEHGLGQHPRKRLLASCALAVAPLAGALTYVLGIGWWKGEAGAVLSRDGEPGLIARRIPARRRGLLPRTSHALLERPGFSSIRARSRPSRTSLSSRLSPVIQLKRRRFSDAAWTAGVLGLAFLTGTTTECPATPDDLPGIIPSLRAVRGRPVLRVAALAASTALLLIRSAFFVNWHFVS